MMVRCEPIQNVCADRFDGVAFVRVVGKFYYFLVEYTVLKILSQVDRRYF